MSESTVPESYREMQFREHRPPCVMHNVVRRESYLDDYYEDQGPCGLPAVAVYITDDDRLKVCPVCPMHRNRAVNDGDGPTFDLVPARQPY